MKIQVLLVFTGAMLSSTVFGVDKQATIGKVKELTAYLDTHTNQSVRGMVDFKLDNLLETPCTRLYLSKEETVSVSLLMAAKAKEVDMKVYYDAHTTSPWNTTVCEVYALEEI